MRFLLIKLANFEPKSHSIFHNLVNMFNFKLLIIFLLIKLISSYFDVQMDRLELIYQDPKCVNFSKIKIRKINKVRSLVGEADFFIPFGNDVTLEGTFLKKQGGEYRLMPYRFSPTPFCVFASNDGEIELEFLITELIVGF